MHFDPSSIGCSLGCKPYMVLLAQQVAWLGHAVLEVWTNDGDNGRRLWGPSGRRPHPSSLRLVSSVASKGGQQDDGSSPRPLRVAPGAPGSEPVGKGTACPGYMCARATAQPRRQQPRRQSTSPPRPTVVRHRTSHCLLVPLPPPRATSEYGCKRHEPQQR
jgi:hypothetical protein